MTTEMAAFARTFEESDAATRAALLRVRAHARICGAGARKGKGLAASLMVMSRTKSFTRHSCTPLTQDCVRATRGSGQGSAGYFDKTSQLLINNVLNHPSSDNPLTPLTHACAQAGLGVDRHLYALQTLAGGLSG